MVKRVGEVDKVGAVGEVGVNLVHRASLAPVTSPTSPSLVELAPVSAIDPDSARRLFGQFATGVAVVTATTASGRPAGMTASSIATVSLEPPLVLICVHAAADFHPAIIVASRFAINILASDQEGLARRFATELPDKFAGVPYHSTPGTPPVLEHISALLECELWRVEEAADHSIVFGKVTGGAVFDRAPLLHYRSQYTTTRPGP